jgi:hypothetical protein
MNRYRLLQGAKFPIEAGGDLSIETHSNQPGGDSRRRRLRTLGGAAKAGRGAEEAVERHRRKRQPNHAGDYGNQQYDSRSVSSAAQPARHNHLLTPHPDNRDGVEQRDERNQHRY